MLGPPKAELEGQPPSAGLRPGTPGYRLSAAEFPLVYGTQRLGMMLVDSGSVAGEPGLAGLLDDLARRVAFALDRAHGRRRAAATSRILQQSLRPATMGEIPGLESSVVYEPAVADCAVGGDFYDLFQAGADRWCLVLGDVCGNGPEAAAVTGLPRHAARLLARDGHGATAVLDRLNRAVADDYAPDRFLSMLCVELVPLDGGGARLRLASAGHPLPLLLRGTARSSRWPGRSCFWAWYRIPAIAPTWPSYARATRWSASPTGSPNARTASGSSTTTTDWPG